MGPCSFGDLASVSPNGPSVPGDLQARPFRAEKLTQNGPALTTRFSQTSSHGTGLNNIIDCHVNVLLV